MNNSIEIFGLSDSHIAYCEASGLSLCFAAYAKHCSNAYIMQIGFNQYSGYIYIALEDGVTICSMLGRKVEYLVSDFETGEEHFFETLSEAESFLSPQSENA